MVVIDLDLVIVPTLIIAILSCLGAIIYLKKSKVNRTISKGNEESILSHYNVLMQINEDQKTAINSQRMKITMLVKKIKEMEGFEEEEEPDLIDVKSIMPFAQKLGISEPQLNAILQSDDAKKFLKKNKGLLQSVLPLLSGVTQNQQNPNDLPSIPQDTA